MAQGNEHLIRQADEAIRRMHAMAMKLRETDLRTKGFVGHDTAQRLQYLQDSIQAKYDDIARYRSFDRQTADVIYENQRAAKKSARPPMGRQTAGQATEKAMSAAKGASVTGKLGRAAKAAGKVAGKLAPPLAAAEIGMAVYESATTPTDPTSKGRMRGLTRKQAESANRRVSGMGKAMRSSGMHTVKTPRGYANVPAYDDDGNEYAGPQAAYLGARRGKKTIKTYKTKAEAEKAMEAGG